METENSTPEVETEQTPAPDASDPAIAALLRERKMLDDSLRKLGYTENSTPSVTAPDGFYPLHDFGKAPEIESVEAAKARLREQEPKAPLKAVETDLRGEAISEPTPPVDIDDERIIRDAWRKSSVNDREILVGCKSIGSGNIDAITKGTNAIFHKGMQVWTVRRAIYGSKTDSPTLGTLLARGLIEQTDPLARGRIKYTLTDLGRKAVNYGASQSSGGKLTP